jgi:pyruvate/2-oxoglutarate dehydrogenase complex dihydrolipoamide dehydrogenase (E3) component
MTTTVDAVVIGAGSGGLTVAVGLAARGRQVALVEAGHVGGDCTNVGCVPSKTLIHQARTLGAGGAATALAHVRRKRDDLRERETREFGSLANVELVAGRARLLPPADRRRPASRHAVAVTTRDDEEHVIGTTHVVVATGARPRELDVPGLPGHRRLTNETVFDLPDAPGHLVVLGGGVIGMELAFAFRRLGSRVTVVTVADRVMERSLPDVGEALAGSLARHGITLHAGARADSYDEATRTLRIVDGTGAGTDLPGVDHVLMAVGRRRSTDDLGLAEVGVRLDAGGAVPTDGYGRTAVAGLWAVGDVTRTAAHTHSANAQGRRVVQRIALGWLPARSPEPAYPTATFSEPEVATAGTMREQLTRCHPDLVTRIRVDLATGTDRGYTDDTPVAFLVVDAIRLTGTVVGATIVGPRASEMAPLFALAVQERISLYRLFRLVQPYPTFSSGVQRVADAFVVDTLGNLRREVVGYLRHRWARR